MEGWAVRNKEKTAREIKLWKGVGVKGVVRGGGEKPRGGGKRRKKEGGTSMVSSCMGMSGKVIHTREGVVGMGLGDPQVKRGSEWRTGQWRRVGLWRVGKSKLNQRV